MSKEADDLRKLIREANEARQALAEERAEARGFLRDIKAEIRSLQAANQAYVSEFTTSTKKVLDDEHRKFAESMNAELERINKHVQRWVHDAHANIEGFKKNKALEIAKAIKSLLEELETLRKTSEKIRRHGMAIGETSGAALRDAMASNDKRIRWILTDKTPRWSTDLGTRNEVVVLGMKGATLSDAKAHAKKIGKKPPPGNNCFEETCSKCSGRIWVHWSQIPKKRSAQLETAGPVTYMCDSCGHPGIEIKDERTT